MWPWCWPSPLAAACKGERDVCPAPGESLPCPFPAKKLLIQGGGGEGGVGQDGGEGEEGLGGDAAAAAGGGQGADAGGGGVCCLQVRQDLRNFFHLFTSESLSAPSVSPRCCHRSASGR